MNVLLISILVLLCILIFSTGMLLTLGLAGMVAPFVGMSPVVLQWMAGGTFATSILISVGKDFKK